MNNTTLVRETFHTSLLMEFFSKKQLRARTGHGQKMWPFVILKELLDNALDACEEVGVLPTIEITISDRAISVKDNGPGIDLDVIKGILDFSKRISSRDYYLSPTRGQQGNALKTLIAIPYVLHPDGEPEPIVIESRGWRHTIRVWVDPIIQEPQTDLATVQIADSDTDPFCKQNPGGASSDQAPTVQTGTSVRVPFCLQNLEDEEANEDQEDEDQDDGPDEVAAAKSLHAQFFALVQRFALFNPHASFTLTDGDQVHRYERTTDAVTKWLPSAPTDPHWYDVDQLRLLMCAYISLERLGRPALFLRDLLGLFHGLKRTGTRGAILEKLDLSGMKLHDLVIEGGGLDPDVIASLLTAMQDAARPVQPTRFGLLGDAHLTAWLTRHGCQDIVYAKTLDVDENGRPFVVETAFGYRPSASARLIVTGINSSPCLGDPFRELDENETSLADLLGESYLHEDSPTMVIVHLTAPCLSYTDQGKSSLAELGAIGEAITTNVTKITRAWTKHQERRIRAHNRAVAWRPARVKKESLKEICWPLIPAAYEKAAGSVGMAFARQIFYAVRAAAQLGDEKTLTSSYFIHTLLVDYMDAHPDHGFDVIFDDRGHFTEPHTGRTIGLGTLPVRHYVDASLVPPEMNIALGQLSTDYPTHGPTNRYANVLIVEKEGFFEIFKRAGINTRYDIAFASSKGMNSVAIRTLVEMLPVRFFCLHDFDKSGFSILGTLTRNTRRYRFKHKADVIDLGVRLDDVVAEHLASEPVAYNTKDPEKNLRLNGATKQEIAFLLADGGQRVELNAFDNDHLLEWLERKLQQHGVKKFIPTEATLTDAYRRALLIHTINHLLDDAVKDAKKDANAAPVPKTLLTQVRRILKANPTMAWDAAVAEIARTA
jgi:DNA topoisomerase VI subunit B